MAVRQHKLDNLWWNRRHCGKSWVIAAHMKGVKIWIFCVQQGKKKKKCSFASSSPLITKPGSESGKLKLPTGEHSKRLSSMNIHPEAPGRFYNMDLASHSPPGSISLPSVSSPALSLSTKAPCLHHFLGQLIVKRLTCFKIVIETLWIHFHTADKRAFSWKEQGLSVMY